MPFQLSQLYWSRYNIGRFDARILFVIAGGLVAGFELESEIYFLFCGHRPMCYPSCYSMYSNRLDSLFDS